MYLVKIYIRYSENGANFSVEVFKLKPSKQNQTVPGPERNVILQLRYCKQMKNSFSKTYQLHVTPSEILEFFRLL